MCCFLFFSFVFFDHDGDSWFWLVLLLIIWYHLMYINITVRRKKRFVRSSIKAHKPALSHADNLTINFKLVKKAEYYRLFLYYPCLPCTFLSLFTKTCARCIRRIYFVVIVEEEENVAFILTVLYRENWKSFYSYDHISKDRQNAVFHLLCDVSFCTGIRQL